MESQLALHGGSPVFPAGAPIWPLADDDVRLALEAAYADGSWGRYAGPNQQRLIDALSQAHDVPHALPCCSGTIAVELALRGMKIGPGDEVILAAYDFPGNFRAIEMVGARPVLVDLKAGAWTLDEQQLAAAVSPQTKVILVSHLHGSIANMPAICTFAEQHGLGTVEDTCQMPGANVYGRIAGSWGDVGVHSFGGSKLLTAGRGGALITRRDDVAQRIKVFCERGNHAFPLSELQAAVLVPQLGKLAQRNVTRWRNVQQLLAACRDMPGIELLPLPAAGNIPSFYKLGFLLTSAADEADAQCAATVRKRFIAAIQAEGVAIDEGFRGFAGRTNTRCRTIGEVASARRAAAGTLLLHHPVLLESPATIERVAYALAKIANANRP
jgi:dTDP-4-amino-4,6-dideoxygalactose transaminase